MLAPCSGHTLHIHMVNPNIVLAFHFGFVSPSKPRKTQVPFLNEFRCISTTPQCRKVTPKHPIPHKNIAEERTGQFTVTTCPQEHPEAPPWDPQPHPRLLSTVRTTEVRTKGLLKHVLVEFPSSIRVICYVKMLEIPAGFTGHWQRVKDWEWMLI